MLSSVFIIYDFFFIPRLLVAIEINAIVFFYIFGLTVDTVFRDDVDKSLNNTQLWLNVTIKSTLTRNNVIIIYNNHDSRFQEAQKSYK